MLIVERQKKLLELLRQRKTAELDEMARTLSVSSSTVRRDLESLEQQGLVKRTHGGAIYQEPAAVTGGQGIETVAARMNEPRRRQAGDRSLCRQPGAAAHDGAARWRVHRGPRSAND